MKQMFALPWRFPARIIALAAGPHPRRERTLMPRFGFTCPQLGMAAGAASLPSDRQTADRCGETFLVVRAGQVETTSLQALDRVAHHHSRAGEFQHVEVVQVVADGHDLVAGEAARDGPSRKRQSLR